LFNHISKKNAYQYNHYWQNNFSTFQGLSPLELLLGFYNDYSFKELPVTIEKTKLCCTERGI